MTVLLILILPLVFLLYASFSKDASGTFTAFLLGVISGLISLFLISLTPLSGISHSPYFWTQVWSFFFGGFFIYSILGLAIFFLISFSISGEVLDTAFSALFGIFSVIFADIAYNSINTPIITQEVLIILIIIGSILIFEFIFNILISNLTLSSDFVVFLISSVTLIVSFFLGSIALASFYLTSTLLTAGLISSGIFLVGIILNVVLSKLN